MIHERRYARPFLSLTLVCGLAASRTGAQPSSDAPSDAQPAAPRPQEEALNALRDPFWPQGWRPPNAGRPAAPGEKLEGQAQWAEARRRIELSGLSRTPEGSYLAILKGAGVVEKGDIISVTLDSLVYKWRIVDITSEGILPARMGVTRNE